MTVRKQSFPALFVFIILFASGCGSSPRSTVNVVPELPAEQTAVVTISDILDVYAYNGIDITKTWYPTGKKRVVKATLPAGETALSFNILGFVRLSPNAFGSLNIENVEIRYSFEAGKEYAITIIARAAEDSNLFFPKYKALLIIRQQKPLLKNGDPILKSWEIGRFE